MSKEINGYDFDDKATRKRMRYLVVLDGDLDLNGAYGFTSKRALKKYLKDSHKDVQAVFSVKSIEKP